MYLEIYTLVFPLLLISKLNFLILLQGNLQKITTQVVLFTVWFICLFVVGSYVCKFFSQFVGWRLCLLLGLSVCWLAGYVCYWVCLFVGLWTFDNIIFLPLGMVSVLDCFITELKLSILNYKWADYWPYWEFIYLFFFYVAFFVMCITMGYFFHVWGGVGVGLFFCFLFCDKYLY